MLRTGIPHTALDSLGKGGGAAAEEEGGGNGQKGREGNTQG